MRYNQSLRGYNGGERVDSAISRAGDVVLSSGLELGEDDSGFGYRWGESRAAY